MLPVMRNNSYLPELFNDFFGLDYGKEFRETMPKINVIENEKEYRIDMAVAGAVKENFSVSLEKENVLSVKFEQKHQSEEENKEEKYLRKEFSYSKFEKSFVIPDNVAKENISAKAENGVLSISLPKHEVKPELENKQIQIA